jgi:photosystem II stability/assembly factor-like uncharacterized protein
MRVSLSAAMCVLSLAISSCTTLPVTTPAPSPTAEEPTDVVPTPTSSLQPSLQAISPTPAETPSSTQTSLPAPATQPAAPAHFTAGNPLQLDEIHMVSRTEGWGIRGAYVLTTSDGGQTWREVTPNVDQADTIYGAFLDKQTAWIIFSNTGHVDQVLKVYYTIDGGQNWSLNPGPPITTTVMGDSTWAQFAVLDARNVWIMLRGVYVGAGTHFNHELFRTTDGGITWNSLDGQISSDYTGMVFADTMTGLRTLQTTGAYGPGAPAFELTTDGGVNWENRELPPPSDAPDLFNQYPYCETYQPVLLSPQSIHMLVGCFEYHVPPQQFTSYLYNTQDGGATWTMIHLPDKVHGWQDRLVWFGTNNALLLGREIYASKDAGSTWTDVATVNWDAQFSFVDPQVGWAVARANGQIALVRTTNGGHTWNEVNPTVAE